jgi:hypothetical protein
MVLVGMLRYVVLVQVVGIGLLFRMGMRQNVLCVSIALVSSNVVEGELESLWKDDEKLDWE